MLFALYVELHAAEVVLLGAAAADDHPHADLVGSAFLGVMAVAAQYLASLPLLHIVVRNVQLRHRLRLIYHLAQARFGANLPYACNQVLHLILLLLLYRRHYVLYLVLVLRAI